MRKKKRKATYYGAFKSNTFKVKDRTAFEKMLKKIGFVDASKEKGACEYEYENGRFMFWGKGKNVTLTMDFCKPLPERLHKYLPDGEKVIVHNIGYRKGHNVEGHVIIVTKGMILYDNLEAIGKRLLLRLNRKEVKE